MRIYLNNSVVYSQSAPFKTAVAVDAALFQAEEMLRGVAEAQTEFSQAGQSVIRAVENSKSPNLFSTQLSCKRKAFQSVSEAIA